MGLPAASGCIKSRQSAAPAHAPVAATPAPTLGSSGHGAGLFTHPGAATQGTVAKGSGARAGAAGAAGAGQGATGKAGSLGSPVDGLCEDGAGEEGALAGQQEAAAMVPEAAHLMLAPAQYATMTAAGATQLHQQQQVPVEAAAHGVISVASIGPGTSHAAAAGGNAPPCAAPAPVAAAAFEFDLNPSSAAKAAAAAAATRRTRRHTMAPLAPVMEPLDAAAEASVNSHAPPAMHAGAAGTLMPGTAMGGRVGVDRRGAGGIPAAGLPGGYNAIHGGAPAGSGGVPGSGIPAAPGFPRGQAQASGGGAVGAQGLSSGMVQLMASVNAAAEHLSQQAASRGMHGNAGAAGAAAGDASDEGSQQLSCNVPPAQQQQQQRGEGAANVGHMGAAAAGVFTNADAGQGGAMGPGAAPALAPAPAVAMRGVIPASVSLARTPVAPRQQLQFSSSVDGGERPANATMAQLSKTLSTPG